MKHYIDKDGNIYGFEDDVVVSGMPGSLVFASAHGDVLDVPAELSRYSLPAPTSGQQLASAQAVQIATLNAACARSIVAGFTSGALGSAYSYPSTLTDQANQNSVAQCSSGGLLWCATGGTWSFKSHSQEQAQGVVASFTTWLNQCQQKLVTLSGQVSAATTVSAVQAVVW
ncbi:hypothetical protein J4G52_30975 [Burkholderia cenocepacia]|uniref:DUF4376 domain-containing protein n=1 Tax=Burkholderia cenocepacia TaxID=95486 RepID=UPI001AA0CDFC|nr:hypothetical protein [Burkholderia cenocepacia]MBO1857979.1 hypothetical protein [Burkholderia cenocepacia]